MEFTRKSNRDRHVRSKHTGDIDRPSFGELSYGQPNESNPDFKNSEHRDEMNLSLICSQTPIYEVTERLADDLFTNKSEVPSLKMNFSLGSFRKLKLI